MTAGSCPVDGGPGQWSYFVGPADGGGAALRTGDSPHTTRGRMELLAVLRGLEAVPAGAAVRLLVADDTVAVRIGGLIRGGGADERSEPAGTPDRAADLWRRVAAALARYEVVPADEPPPAAGTRGRPGEGTAVR
jgi:ribonuclease HI